jgi:Co/Zn/Cd efflux system component
MKHCCEDKAEALRALRHRQRRMLTVVLAINASMFVLEAASGLLSRSTALLGDSLDMFGDAAVYGLTIYALDRGTIWRARAAIIKGCVMAAFGIGVFAEAASKMAGQVVPHAQVMGGVGLLALIANGACLVLLLRHRQDDINMKSAWICSRNDIAANLSVLGASALVWSLHSFWPDVIVGVAIALLFLVSAVGVVRDSLKSLRDAGKPGELVPEGRLS